MKHISKNENGTFTIIIHLQPEERKRLKKLADKLGLNDFEAIKYAIQLVSWWSRNAYCCRFDGKRRTKTDKQSYLCSCGC